MFALGLEFSLRKLVRVGPTAGLTAIIQSSIMIWLGFLAGRAFGWSSRESIFAGAVVAISSTTIIAKVFDEQQIRGQLRELVVGVLIVEDLIAILLMAILTAISTGSGVSAGDAARLTAAGWPRSWSGCVAVGLLVVPRAVRAMVPAGPAGDHARGQHRASASPSALLRPGLRLLGGPGGLHRRLAGGGVGRGGGEVEHLVLPVSDLFAAIFFVSVGMLIDPAVIARHWLAVAVFTLLVIGGKVLGVTRGRLPDRATAPGPRSRRG